ncbi:hypothetical protein [Bradyrhizobium tropiciagri]|nr:hypothetical protein [Bradyrhizobium tropiciagri]
MTTGAGFDLERLIATNASAAFNRLVGLEVISAARRSGAAYALAR